MIKGKQLLLFALLLFFIASCKDDFDPYAKPDWLEGKVYTQMLAEGNEDLSTFAYCVKKVKYDSVIDVSGSYTVFAPTNEAFDLYFSKHPTYKSVDDIPLKELENLVKYHIVQDPWNRSQLTKLDLNGWIDTLDVNNDEPRGYKRETLLLNPNLNYGVKNGKDKAVLIIDSAATSWHRKVITDSRKYCPIFYQEYFNIYDLPLSDYRFYFDRDFEKPSDLYYGGAKIADNEIFAENGFVYKIDRVVEPLKNANELLRAEYDGYSYSEFLNLVNNFSKFDYNETATFDQEGADQGLKVDSLFDLTYPRLAFAITNEKTSPSNGFSGGGMPTYVSIRFHHGLVAPTNDAFKKFENEYIKGNMQWGSLNNMPDRIKKIIANTYMSSNPIYESDLAKGFYNGEGDKISVPLNSVIQKNYGSNCTFVGVNEYIAPRAFSSITSPVYTQRDYADMMYAIEYAGVLPSLKRAGQEYMFYIVPGYITSVDSSLVRALSVIQGIENNTFYVYAGAGIPGGTAVETRLSSTDLRLLIMNQVGTSHPKGIAKKEFIKTLAGNYLIVNNETGEVRGSDVTTKGYKGAETIEMIPSKIGDFDNGSTYEAKAWFSFSQNGLYSQISTKYPDFHALIEKAGLVKSAKYTFITASQFYTVFAPTKEALDAANANDLTGDELNKFILAHFVQGSLIFTDGNANTGYYESLCESENSTVYAKVYSKVYVETSPDMIKLRAKDGGEYVSIPLSDNTNMMTVQNLDLTATERPFPNVMVTAVIHETNKALIFDELDTK